MILSVVIVSWNVRDVLQTCLELLRPEWERTWAEVIVVDNAIDRWHPRAGTRPLAAYRDAGADCVFVPGL